MAHNDFEQTSVSDSQKRSFFSMFVIMLGFTFFSASMWAGANLGNGLTFKGFIGAVVIGNLILGAYTGLLALIAARTGLSVHLLSRYVFGRYGSYIPSSVLAFTQIGWFGVGVAMFSIPTTSFLMELPSVQNSWFMAGATCNVFGIPYPLPLRLLAILTVLAGVMMSSSAYFGIKALHIISTIAVPAVAVFGCYSAIRALFFDALPPEVVTETVRTGWDLARTHTPPPDAALTMGAAISLAIGSFISGGSCTPDFARFSCTTTIAVTTTVIAFFIGNSMMFFFGAAGAMVYGQNDISMVLKLQGLLLPAIFVLGLNIWTTNDNALYTSGLGISNITGLPKRFVVLFNGTLGTIAAVWLYNNFCGWLNILNTFIPPCGALLIADYFLCKRAHYVSLAEKKFIAFSWPAAISWAVGSFIALATNGTIPGLVCMKWGLPAINGMAVTIVLYLVLTAIVPERKAEAA